jgi:hypothetical protein
MKVGTLKLSQRLVTPSATMIGVAVSLRAYRASKRTLPVGEIALKRERDGQGRYLLCLDEATANSLSLRRRIGESYSDVILRLARV